MLGHQKGVFADELVSPKKLFISNEYVDSQNLESLISEYADHPYFVSSDYKEENDGRDWKRLFRALRITTDTHEIVFKHILPYAGKHRRTDIIELIATHESEISERLKNNDKELKQDLAEIYLECADGEFRKPAQTLLSGKYYDIDNDPFPDIILGNLISDKCVTREGISTANARRIKRLLVTIAD